jgi:hypothetical protein
MSSSIPHTDTFYTNHADLRKDIDAWKALTERLGAGLSALDAKASIEINGLRDELEKYRSERDRAEKQNKKAEKNNTMLKVDVKPIEQKIVATATELMAKVNFYADVLSPEDRADLSKKASQLQGDLVKDSDSDGNSVNHDAKVLQKVLKKTKTLFRLLQQAYKEAQGERKPSSWWPFGGSAYDDAINDENYFDDGVYLASTFGFRV